MTRVPTHLDRERVEPARGRDSNDVRTVNDIEHVPVHDDPRAWSHARKTLTLVIVSSASMIAGIATTMQNPANAEMGEDLHASSADISWSMSVFIILQGLFPLLWSAVSEIKGRKVVYLSSMSLFIVGSAIVACSKTIGLVIGMRALQAVGSSAVLAIAAATLADIYEPHERGAKMGIYYAAPLLGAYFGPFLGGAFAQVLGWRAVFWFSCASGCIVLACMCVLFKDTFRKERSLLHQAVVLRRRVLEERRVSSDRSPSRTVLEKTVQGSEAGTTAPGALDAIHDITPSFTDVNPFPPIIQVLKRWNNCAVLLASGLIYGFSYSLSYTCARTLSTSYGYDALHTGLILLSIGFGSVCGSTLGGYWSDRVLTTRERQNGQDTRPEMRLQSTLPAIALLPLSALGYAWICQTRQHVAAVCAMLFVAGFSSLWIFTSVLAYVVDANAGRSSTAVALNSAFRCVIAFVAVEIAVPLQDRIGDGGLYTVWAGLLVVVDVLVLLVAQFGSRRRDGGTGGGEEAAVKENVTF